MSNSLSKDLGLTEGQTYIISRKGQVSMEGHIYINSPTVSRPHASLKIKNGRVYLHDLDSTNGIYIVDNDNLVSFKEGYVMPNQPIIIGRVKCTIQGLITNVDIYPTPENNSSDIEETQEVDIPVHKPIKKPRPVKN
jgi:hypothetical protein